MHMPILSLSLRILKFEDIIKLQIGKGMYLNYKNSLLPDTFNDMFLLNCDIHSYNTRSKNPFRLPYRPIANMATISPKRGFSVATVAKGWSLVYMLMRVRYLVGFFTLETIKKLSRRNQRRFNVLK